VSCTFVYSDTSSDMAEELVGKAERESRSINGSWLQSEWRVLTMCEGRSIGRRCYMMRIVK